MPLAPRRAVSPDGRVWQVVKIRERPSLAETRKDPFFWGSAVVSVLLIAFFVRMVMVDFAIGGSGLYALAFIVPVALLWLTERTMHLLRPHILAETDGPPAERVEWKTAYPLGTARLMNRAVEAIEDGTHDGEPRGLELLRLEYPSARAPDPFRPA